jgi:hypothetical protein
MLTIVLALLLILSISMLPTNTASASNCGLQQAAFCDTFDAPADNSRIITRSGDLNGVIWGVSRATSGDNPSQGAMNRFRAVTRTICGQTATVGPDRDVAICNGQLTESVNDGGAFTVLAMYPRQPFDIAGRTGTVVFDVSADSAGSHAAWPAFEFTDQPVPAPYHGAAGLVDYPRNSLGFAIDNTPGAFCPAGKTTVMEMWITRNYVEQRVTPQNVGCVKVPTQPGELNHVEVRLSPNHVEIWGTDAGATGPLVMLGDADLQMPLTRGLVWLEDVHYNAEKVSNQGQHTFVWDNFGFDGPILPRDLGFDVPEYQADGVHDGNLGYVIPAGHSRTMTVPGVYGVENAQGALLLFTAYTRTPNTQFTYAFNGHPAQTQTRPGVAIYAADTFAFPVNVSDLVNGTNTFTMSTTDGAVGGPDIANIDLVLLAAGSASPSPGNPPTPTPTTVIPLPTPTPEPPTHAPQRLDLHAGDSATVTCAGGILTTRAASPNEQVLQCVK